MTTTDAAPDLSLLRLIKETELKRLNCIGSGAFGTVYKVCHSEYPQVFYNNKLRHKK